MPTFGLKWSGARGNKLIIVTRISNPSIINRDRATNLSISLALEAVKEKHTNSRAQFIPSVSECTTSELVSIGRNDERDGDCDIPSKRRCVNGSELYDIVTMFDVLMRRP